MMLLSDSVGGAEDNRNGFGNRSPANVTERSTLIPQLYRVRGSHGSPRSHGSSRSHGSPRSRGAPRSSGSAVGGSAVGRDFSRAGGPTEVGPYRSPVAMS